MTIRGTLFLLHDLPKNSSRLCSPSSPHPSLQHCQTQGVMPGPRALLQLAHPYTLLLAFFFHTYLSSLQAHVKITSPKSFH